MAKKDSTDVFMTELDAYLFGEGTHYEIYNKMGAHKAVKDGQEGIGNFISMMDYILDTKRKRHITGGILLSASLLFGGLALTVMTIQNEEDEDE